MCVFYKLDYIRVAQIKWCSRMEDSCLLIAWSHRLWFKCDGKKMILSNFIVRFYLWKFSIGKLIDWVTKKIKIHNTIVIRMDMLKRSVRIWQRRRRLICMLKNVVNELRSVRVRLCVYIFHGCRNSVRARVCRGFLTSFFWIAPHS